MAALTVGVACLAVLYLPMPATAPPSKGPSGIPWLEGLCRWDAGWFLEIASRGYWLEPGQQSPVAFYPLYPLLIRALTPIVDGRYYVAGVLITMASGFGAVLLVNRWMRERIDPRAARLSICVLLLYPFSLFLFGAMYSDALFIVCAVAAFTCLERNRPWLAGLFGAAATAARPVGLAVVVGLAVRAAERRGVFGKPGRRRLRLERVCAADAGVLISLAGMSLYWLFLWLRFDDPLAWIHATAAPGWNVVPGPEAWLKVVLFTGSIDGSFDLTEGFRVFHGTLCLIAYATIPGIWRRFGIGYAVYVFVVMSIPIVSSPDLFGAGRYVLPAFPCFAIAGLYLYERPALARTVLPVSLLAQVAVTALFATWHIVA
jgi:hypothetical protein